MTTWKPMEGVEDKFEISSDHRVRKRGWQPTATAPKNKAVIAASGNHVGEACLISWEDGLHGWYWAEDRSGMTTAPDAWMPFPEPPTTNKEKD